MVGAEIFKALYTLENMVLANSRQMWQKKSIYFFKNFNFSWYNIVLNSYHIILLIYIYNICMSVYLLLLYIKYIFYVFNYELENWFAFFDA